MIKRCILVTLHSDVASSGLVGRCADIFQRSVESVDGLLEWQVLEPADEDARSWDFQILLSFQDLEQAQRFLDTPPVRSFLGRELPEMSACVKAWNFKVVQGGGLTEGH